jgi:hypothetical protein
MATAEKTVEATMSESKVRGSFAMAEADLKEILTTKEDYEKVSAWGGTWSLRMDDT